MQKSFLSRKEGKKKACRPLFLSDILSLRKPTGNVKKLRLELDDITQNINISYTIYVLAISKGFFYLLKLHNLINNKNSHRSIMDS